MRIFIIGSIVGDETKIQEFDNFCTNLGKSLADKKIDLLVCSPYPDSADVKVIEGVKTSKNKNLSIELYYPESAEIETLWNRHLTGLDKIVKVSMFRQEAHVEEKKDAIRYSWLFCQIQAVHNSDFVIVIGGKMSGTSNLLARVADAQGKSIVPYPIFGGVGEFFFRKKRYQLIDAIGQTNVEELLEKTNPEELIDFIVKQSWNGKLTKSNKRNSDTLTFFISYSRDRPAEADYVEALLRRRNYHVIRDESNLTPGQDIPNAIKENILKSDIFIALWSQEYACSPWCFDEISIALESHSVEGKSLWIFRTDKTRIVPPKARKMLWYDTETREEIEGKILSLLH